MYCGQFQSKLTVDQEQALDLKAQFRRCRGYAWRGLSMGKPVSPDSFRNLIAAAMASATKRARTTSWVNLKGGSDCVGAIALSAGIFRKACTTPTDRKSVV